MSTRKTNKIGNEQTSIVSMRLTQEDTDTSHPGFCNVSRSKGIAYDKQRFTRIPFVYSRGRIWMSTVPLLIIERKGVSVISIF